MRELGYLVLGTKQPPLRYTIAVQQGKLALDGGYQGREYTVPLEDILHIIREGWIPTEVMPEAIIES